jgi:hypothetical protein
LFVTGWSLETNPEYYEVDKQVAVFPHTSGWELVLALLVQPVYKIKNVKIIVWNGQFRGPVGPLLKWLGCIPIENNKSTGAVTTISNYLNTQPKFKFCLSPEGSRSYREKFRSGFFYITQNTGAIYNVITFDYEHHVMHFGNLLDTTGDFQQDCDNIAEIFSEEAHLYPECTFYGSRPHSHTSMVNWICLSNVVGFLNTWLLWHYHHPWFALWSLIVTTASFLYHNSKEKHYRAFDWFASVFYLVSLYAYRWLYTGVVWKSAVIGLAMLFLFVQAGHNNRYTNHHYRKWHLIYHLATFPITLLEIWVHS